MMLMIVAMVPLCLDGIIVVFAEMTRLVLLLYLLRLISVLVALLLPFYTVLFLDRKLLLRIRMLMCTFPGTSTFARM